MQYIKCHPVAVLVPFCRHLCSH